MLDAAAQLLKYRLRPTQRCRVRSDQAEEFPLLRRPHGAADRALDQLRLLMQHPPGQRARGLGAHGAHLDEQLALDLAREQPMLAQYTASIAAALVRMVMIT